MKRLEKTRKPRSQASLRDAAVHGHLRELQADESVVGFEHRFPQRVNYPQSDPLVAPLPKRGSRTPLVGNPVVGAAEYQNLDELLENHSVGYAGAVAA
jgi:hypothetical protein